MDALADVWAQDTSIKEFPPSIGNLAGLECLNLSYCKSIRELPNSLFTLQNLSWLDLEDFQLDSRKSLRKLMQERQPVINCTSVQFLNLRNCGLLDEDICLTLNLFRNLIMLTLSGNDFVSLPECLKECDRLWRLDVNDCKRLRDIPELPSSLLKIGAEKCISLTTESLGHLWSLVFQVNKKLMDMSPIVNKEVMDMSAIFPATTFPNWFHNWCEGGKISFLARRNFPPIAFAFELGKAKSRRQCSFHFFLTINGRVIRKEYYGILVAPGHMSLFNFGVAFSGKDWRCLQRSMGLDWNEVEIEVTCSVPDIAVVKCGVCVYEQQTNLDNIQFKSPLMLSMNNASTTSSLKRRAIPSPSNGPNKKFLRKLKVSDKGKLDKTNKGSRRNKRHQLFYLRCKRTRTVCPMGKHVWRFLNYFSG